MNSNCGSDLFALLNHTTATINNSQTINPINLNPQSNFIPIEVPIIYPPSNLTNIQYEWNPNPNPNYNVKSQIFYSHYLFDNEYTQPNDYSHCYQTNESNSTDESSNKRKKFSKDEDIQLKKLIDIQGPKKWDKIAQSMPGRTGRQCRDRFYNYLDPSLTNGPWSIEEDILLEKKVVELGQHWNIISKFFKGRSTNNIKNRWYTYICYKKKSHSHKINITNNKYNDKIINYHLSNDIINDNNHNQQIDNDIQNTNDLQGINSIIPLNTNRSKNDVSKNNFGDIDVISTKSTKEKKLLFPSLISPNSEFFMF